VACNTHPLTIHILFACSIAAALFRLLAGLVGSGATCTVLGAKWVAYAVGAALLVVGVALVAVRWCAAVCDTSLTSYLWCKRLLGYDMQDV
jgi:hypothetical protein